jgi:hypothetical protein
MRMCPTSKVYQHSNKIMHLLILPRYWMKSSRWWINLMIMNSNKVLKSLKIINQLRSWCKNVKMNLIKKWLYKQIQLLLLQNKKKKMNYTNSIWMLRSKSIIRLPSVLTKLQFPYNKNQNKLKMMLNIFKMTVRKSKKKSQLALINKILNLFNIIRIRILIYYEN